MRKILTAITLSVALIFTSILPVFASEQQTILATDQTYTEWSAQKDVPANKVWSIKLSAPILASTVTDQNIYVVDSSGQHQNVTVTLGADTKTIQVTPMENYKSGASYTLYILKAVSSASPQVALKSNIRMQFTTVADVITVKSVIASNVTTIAGTAPVLPSTVTANMSDGTTKTVNVTWTTPTASQYASAGTFTLNGTIAESTTVKAIANVTVVKLEPTINSISDITKTINQGDLYSLPSTIEATMSDDAKKQVTVTWSNVTPTTPSISYISPTINCVHLMSINSSSQAATTLNSLTVDTSKAGTYTFSGSVDGYSGQVKLTLTINAPQYSISNPAPLNIAQTIHIQDYSYDYTAEMEAETIIRGTEAWNLIYAANMFNSPPKDGYEYILAKINFRLLDIKDGKSLDLYIHSFKLVSESNKVYDDSYSVVEPDPQIDATLYKGATSEGWETFLVKKDDLHPKFVFGKNYDGTGGIWFQAYPASSTGTVIAAATLTYITITPPAKTTYDMNEALNTTGMKVMASYSDNTSKDVTSQCINNFDSSTAGSKSVTVAFQNKTATFAITIKNTSQIELIRQQYLTDLDNLMTILNNVKANKCVQQLTKLPDGSWDFVYVADQAAVNRAQKNYDDKYSEYQIWEAGN